MQCLASPQPQLLIPSLHLLVCLQWAWKMQFHHHPFVHWNMAGPDTGHMHVCVCVSFKSFPLSFTLHFHPPLFLSPPLLVKPLSECHAGEMMAPQLLIVSSTRPPRVLSVCMRMQLCTTVKLYSVQDKWGLACSLPVRAAFICSEMRQLGRDFSLLPYEKDRQKWNIERQNERRDTESGVASASWLWLGGKQMLAHVLCISTDITVFNSGLTHWRCVADSSALFLHSLCCKHWAVMGGRA